MKKLLVLAAALLTFGFANAQVFYIGYQNNQFNTKMKVLNTTATDKQNASGFVVGYGQNFNISGAFGVQPALEMSFNSHKAKSAGIESTATNFGVKVPIDLNYGFSLSPDFKLNVFAGPTLYLGIVDSEKVGDQKVNMYEDFMKRFSFGVDFGAWCDIKDLIRVKVGYDLGLSNMLQDGTSDYSMKQNCLTIAVGYLF